LPAAIVADRAFTSRPSLHRIEQGDSTVSMGIYAAVLQALGLLDRLNELADSSHDTTGVALATEKLPQRVRLPRPAGTDDA
jgi:hypothetical protein